MVVTPKGWIERGSSFNGSRHHDIEHTRNRPGKGAGMERRKSKGHAEFLASKATLAAGGWPMNHWEEGGRGKVVKVGSALQERWSGSGMGSEAGKPSVGSPSTGQGTGSASRRGNEGKGEKTVLREGSSSWQSSH